jgi:site-specific DNA-methyltransferase (cytosine-N4-specific)
MPESVTDRPTRSHEHIFLLSKRERYFYDADAIAESAVRPGDVQTFGGQKGRDYNPMHDDPNFRNGHEQWGRTVTANATRNKRDVWTVAPSQFAEAHFATFPPDLIEPCILAGSAPGDTVLDPFSGSGTTAAVALKHHRQAIGIELNKAYLEMAHNRIGKTQYVLPIVEAK